MLLFSSLQYKTAHLFLLFLIFFSPHLSSLFFSIPLLLPWANHRYSRYKFHKSPVLSYRWAHHLSFWWVCRVSVETVLARRQSPSRCVSSRTRSRRTQTPARREGTGRWVVELHVCLIVCVCVCLVICLVICLVVWLVVWLIICLFVCLFGWLVDWLVKKWMEEDKRNESV